MRHQVWSAIVASPILAALIFSACGGGSDGNKNDATPGPERSFLMGFSTLPRELNADSYAETFALAADAGDMVLIQRTPPWEEFLPGGSVGSATADTTAAEIAAVDDHDLKLFFAIDPTDAMTGRDRIGGLPSSYEGRGFDDAGIRSAFASYAEYVTINYEPSYLALGVEMNLYLQRNEDDLDNFESLYKETYDRVKAVRPETQVTLTFQYEDMQSLLPTEDRHFPDWSLIERFEPMMDVMAISTYPSFAFSRVADMPKNYYSQLRGFTDRPIVIAEMGFSSAAAADGANNGSEPEQKAFVERIIDEAATLKMPLVVWFAAWDPAYAEGSTFSAFAHVGLLRTDGSEKPAWDAWQTTALRPFAGMSE